MLLKANSGRRSVQSDHSVNTNTVNVVSRHSLRVSLSVLKTVSILTISNKGEKSAKNKGKGAANAVRVITV